MIQIKDSQYDLVIDKENQNIEFTLGNLSDAGWYWSRTSEDDILLFFFRLYKSTVWDEFLSSLKEEAESNKEDWDWFIERISTPNDEMKRQFVYGYIGDNEYKSYLSSAIDNYVDFLDLPYDTDELYINDDEFYKKADKLIDEETAHLSDFIAVIREFIDAIKNFDNHISFLDEVNLGEERAEFWLDFVDRARDTYPSAKLKITIDDELGDEIDLKKVTTSLGGKTCQDCDIEVARLLAKEYAENNTDGFVKIVDWIELSEQKFDWGKYRDIFVNTVEQNQIATIDENTLNYLDNYIFEKFGDAPQLFNKGE